MAISPELGEFGLNSSGLPHSCHISAPFKPCLVGARQPVALVMTDSYNDFQARVARIYALNEQTSKRGSRRVALTTTRDGHLVIRGARPRFEFPWTGLLFIVVAVFMLKGAVIARFGVADYEAQLARFEASTRLEQLGAWTMRPDPISSWIALQIQYLS